MLLRHQASTNFLFSFSHPSVSLATSSLDNLAPINLELKTTKLTRWVTPTFSARSGFPFRPLSVCDSQSKVNDLTGHESPVLGQEKHNNFKQFRATYAIKCGIIIARQTLTFIGFYTIQRNKMWALRRLVFEFCVLFKFVCS